MTPSAENPYTAGRFRSALLHYVFGRAAQGLAVLAFTLVGIRVLAAADFGAYMVVQGLVEMCRPLVSLGLVPMIQQYLPALALHGARREIRRFLAWALLLRLLLTGMFAAVIVAFWPLVSAWLGFTEIQRDDMRWAGLLVLTALTVDYSATVLESLLHQRLAQPLRTLLAIGRLIGLLVLVKFGAATIGWLLAIELFVAAFLLLLGEWWVWHSVGCLTPDGTRHVTRRELLDFAWNMTGAQLLATAANTGVLRILVARVGGLEVAAQYAFLQQLVLYVSRMMPSIQLAGVVRPMLVARHTAGQWQWVAAAGAFLWKANIFLFLPILCVVYVGGAGLVSMLSGGALRDSGWALSVMVVVPVMVAQEHLASTLLQVHRRSDLVRALNLQALLAPVSVAAGAFSFGLMGAVVGTMIGIGLQSCVTMLVSLRVCRGLSLDWSAALRAMAGVTVIAVAAGWLSPATPIQVAISMATVLGAYALLLVLIARPLTTSEYEWLREVFGSRAAWLNMLVQRG